MKALINLRYVIVLGLLLVSYVAFLDGFPIMVSDMKKIQYQDHDKIQAPDVDHLTEYKQFTSGALQTLDSFGENHFRILLNNTYTKSYYKYSLKLAIVETDDVWIQGDLRILVESESNIYIAEVFSALQADVISWNIDYNTNKEYQYVLIHLFNSAPYDVKYVFILEVDTVDHALVDTLLAILIPCVAGIILMFFAIFGKRLLFRYKLGWQKAKNKIRYWLYGLRQVTATNRVSHASQQPVSIISVNITNTSIESVQPVTQVHLPPPIEKEEPPRHQVLMPPPYPQEAHDHVAYYNPTVATQNFNMVPEYQFPQLPTQHVQYLNVNMYPDTMVVPTFYENPANMYLPYSNNPTNNN